MLSKSKIKFVRSLQLRKYRQKYHKIVVEGGKIVADVLNDSLMTLDEIFATNDWVSANQQLLNKARGEVTKITQNELAKVSGFKTAPPVLAVGSPPDLLAKTDAPQHRLCLYLDGVSDPGNLGTILRIADWFGYREVFLSPDCVDIHNPKVIQASMSSVFRVRTHSCKLEELATSGSVYGASLDGQSVFDIEVAENGVLVLGSESHGIRTEALQGVDTLIKIPSTLSLGAESLNVATAAAVLCAHFRQPGRKR